MKAESRVVAALRVFKRTHRAVDVLPPLKFYIYARLWGWVPRIGRWN
jgi:hypothetical protein